MLSCILRSPLQVAFSQAVRHDLSGGLLTCLVVLGQKCTIVCTGAERSSLWRRCRLWRRFPLCFRQMQQGCRCDDLSLSLNVCPFNVLMTWYILYLYYFTLNKSCLSPESWVHWSQVSRMNMLLEQRRQAMLQLHRSDQQFNGLLRADVLEVWWYFCFVVDSSCHHKIVYHVGVILHQPVIPPMKISTNAFW